MKTMHTKKYISLMAALLFMDISSPVEACSCLSFSLQTAVCNAKAVFQVKFLQPSERPGASPTTPTKGYTIIITKVLKGHQELKSVTFIRTMSGTTCEYHHSPNGYNEEYLITASNDGGNLTVSSCSYIAKWSGLSPKQIRGVEEAYFKGCNCKIVTCYSQPCSLEPKTCIIEEYKGGNAENQKKNQVCIPKNSTKCIWKTIE